MKILIIQGSPDAGSLSHANAENYYQRAKKLGLDVQMVDLAKDQFDPVLRYGYRKHMEDEAYPNQMQTLIQTADHLAFFFPVWWSAEPAVLKGWFDRVFTPGFAYHYDNGKTIKLLKGKTASLFITSHAPTFFYGLYGGVISRWKHMLLGFCGVKLTHKLILGNMDKTSDTDVKRKQFIKKCANTLIKS
ncbi:NAD(P)H-dependent oxidoreductase (plasmid) [Nicoliella spurrieriana]|uniref:NAD(P)H-dependent oxidoreductase n=1 Tax=Nicoliella spurrieriana TaxID=2925830 RepID=A0A976RRC4_9LACO|nr:NAD(P)H-dependent oxidoreductase [Nicoliella spurrieriana]UQS86211.1 NAD(P)H-dependent oxidoreductase [Nicoliella spurrieriana]